MAEPAEARNLAVPSEPSRIGQTSARPLRGRRLGGGRRHGSVYEATHLTIGGASRSSSCARSCATTEDVGTIRARGRAAGALENENICSIIDVGLTRANEPCLVMNTWKVKNLARVLELEGPLPIPRAVELVQQVCRGLDAAHRAGVIHRDLKPKNLIVCRHNDGTDWLKIRRFRHREALRTRRVARRQHDDRGDAGHAALHVARAGSPATKARRAHRRLLGGVILYELLSGEKPIPASYNAIIYHILSKQRVPPPRAPARSSEGLAAIVHRAMALEPEERVASARELERALARTLRAGSGAWRSTPTSP